MASADTNKKKVVFVNPMIVTGKNLGWYSIQMTKIGSLISDEFRPLIITGTSFLRMNSHRTIDDVSVFASKSIRIPILSQIFYALGEWFANLEKRLDAWKPDCIVCAEDFSLSTLQCIQYGKKKGIPTILYSGLYYYAGLLNGLPHYIFSKTIGRKIYLRSDAIVAKTRSAKLFLENLRCDSRKIHVIPPTIDMTRFKRVKEDMLTRKYSTLGKIVILFVGSLIPVKNPMALLEAFRELCEDKDAHLIMVSSQGSLSGDVSRYVRQNNLQSKVTIIPYMPLSDMPILYSSADILVSSSLMEIFGMTMLESLSCGTPVIATPTAGANELIVNGENGQISSDFEASSIAQSMKFVLNDKPELIGDSDKIRLSIIGKFDELTIAKSWKKLLHAVMSS